MTWDENGVNKMLWNDIESKLKELKPGMGVVHIYGLKVIRFNFELWLLGNCSSASPHMPLHLDTATFHIFTQQSKKEV